MGILSTAAAESVKRAVEVGLPDRLSVVRLTRTVDPNTGAWTDDEETYASGIPCRVDKSGLTSRERVVAERLGSVATFRLMVSTLATRWPGGTPSTLATDKLVVTGDGAGTYEPAEDGGPVTDELVREIVVTKVE